MIKGIIFDAGNTLFRFNADGPLIARQGATEMATWYLKKKHVKLDSQALVDTYLAEREAGWQRALETHTEVLAEECLRVALKKIAAPAAAVAFVEAAIKISYGPAEAAWQPYPDAVETLKKLQAAGYRQGLLSNAPDDKMMQRMVNQGKLRPLLSPTFSSAGLGLRKPKPEPFLLIAKRWALPPAQIVVVGDTLAADVLGAQNAGMHSILVTMDESPSNADNRHIQPTATAATLSDLPDLIAQL